MPPGGLQFRRFHMSDEQGISMNQFKTVVEDFQSRLNKVAEYVRHGFSQIKEQFDQINKRFERVEGDIHSIRHRSPSYTKAKPKSRTAYVKKYPTRNSPSSRNASCAWRRKPHNFRRHPASLELKNLPLPIRTPKAVDPLFISSLNARKSEPLSPVSQPC